MRNEQEMFDLILNVAKEDERVRAVYMNGSRTNPNVPKDIFQDYDIVYVVEDITSFINDEGWIKIFGDLLMVQEPDKLDKGKGEEADFTKRYAYLMLFTDGNRIDLSLQSIDYMLSKIHLEPAIPLLDKNNILPKVPDPTGVEYHVKAPTEGEYNSVTNNFWWCSQNVAKGIWRDELPYAKLMFEYTMRDAVDQMVAWWIGMQHDYQLSVGKLGKYFKNYLPKDYWKMYKNTYSNADYEHMWESIFTSAELFRILAQDVAKYHNFNYPTKDDHSMTKYLKRVRELSGDAKGIF
ncbi:aminoglycoside 6-adenylyltransferase [Filobacillus milosensis]|uniref:Aminoglycoside 6-adenylyltransferase n=1 Tax=Filobacillus milosensis TaxID=94137 RepID=A0A4Y8IL92_9BACI|nr:aminoglycoside 6-adenylyltransferase [Filobacillus milosensis]TFB22061.1 aminoglycoside 6-adenylyltransferase [Filobacillus milosensis]